MPRATVVIPTYNYSSVLRYSVASVLRQTMEDFELLVVGDGCTDDSGEVVRSFADPRVRWINLPENCGEQTGPNNEGIRQAVAPVVVHFGHDDLMLPWHLEVLCAAIDSGADIAHGIVTQISTTGHPTTGARRMGAYRGGFLCPSGVAIRTDAARAIGGWRMSRDIPDGYQNPDSDYFLRLRDSGCVFREVRRLVAVKFPAVSRRNCYVEKPCAEQAEYTRRIQEEPDFEARELCRLMEGLETRMHDERIVGVRAHLRALLAQIRRSVRTRTRSGAPRPGSRIDRCRKARGLDIKPRDS